MAHLVTTSFQRRNASAILIALTFSAVLLSGCQREAAPVPPPVVDNPLQSDLEEVQRKIADLGKSLAAKDGELKAAAAAVEADKTQIAEKELVVAKKDAQVRSLQSEIDALKKRDAFVFAEISALQHQGQASAALARYQQFIKDFPKSPLAANATSAINELTVTTEQEARQRAFAAEPKSRQREFVQQFEDGFLTLQELAPVLKKKSVAQVLALLGPPNRVFGEGTEIGYVDKAIDPVTGKRGTFIIAFEFDTVANLRVEYAGRRLVP